MLPADVEYPLRFAKWAQLQNTRYFGLLSYAHAMSTSSRPLQKLKGLTEQSIRDMRFQHVSFFRPAWIYRPEPQRKDSGPWLEWAMKKFQWTAEHKYRFVMPFMYIPVRVLPTKNRTVDAETVAKAMVRDAELFLSGNYSNGSTKMVGRRGVQRLYYDDFKRLAAAETGQDQPK